MKHRRGFTTVELIIVIALFAVAGVVFFIQKDNLEISLRDSERKADINALYYSLEEVYFKKHNSYPNRLSVETLGEGIDKSILVDPAGVTISKEEEINDQPTQSTYRYEPTGCVNEKCRGYTLRATLENEADYVKSNRSSES